MKAAAPLGPAFAGEAPLTHRAWLHLVTAARRIAFQGKHTPGKAIQSPVVRVQVQRQGVTLCATVLEPVDAPDGAELFRCDVEHLGRCTVSARNVRVCGACCTCGGQQ